MGKRQGEDKNEKGMRVASPESAIVKAPRSAMARSEASRTCLARPAPHDCLLGYMRTEASPSAIGYVN